MIERTLPKKIANYSEFVYTLTPDEQRVLELEKIGLQRLTWQSEKKKEHSAALLSSIWIG